MSKQVKQLVFIVFILCFTTSQIQAQYGYGNRNGRQGRNTIPQAPPREPEVKTPEEIVNEEMPNITSEIGLDPFEEAVVRTILIKYIQKHSELRILQLEPRKMKEEVEKLQKSQDEELKAGLPEEKYDAFKELQKNRFKKIKKKKKKKKKS